MIILHITKWLNNNFSNNFSIKATNNYLLQCHNAGIFLDNKLSGGSWDSQNIEGNDFSWLLNTATDLVEVCNWGGKWFQEGKSMTVYCSMQ